jgi:hypothetical protein
MFVHIYIYNNNRNRKSDIRNENNKNNKNYNNIIYLLNERIFPIIYILEHSLLCKFLNSINFFIIVLFDG